MRWSSHESPPVAQLLLRSLSSEPTLSSPTRPTERPARLRSSEPPSGVHPYPKNARDFVVADLEVVDDFAGRESVLVEVEP